MTIAAFDAHYLEGRRTSVAAVVFNGYDDHTPTAEYHRIQVGTAAYVPGAFYKRELPAILALLDVIELPLDTLIVDGYVMLGSRPGLGKHLFEALAGRIPVIGVAKNRFKETSALSVYRGVSRNPLYVTAAGIDVSRAGNAIRKMRGAYRIPTLLKRVDQLAREKAG
jgi:deoxyribonuclease V